MKKHPPVPDLALYAGGDLPLWQRLPLALHVRRCEDCRREVEAFRQALAALREAGDEPVDLDWKTLEAEMRANIRLGLAAGEAVRRSSRLEDLHRTDWRALAVVTASLAVVAVVGWTLQRPRMAGPDSPAWAEVTLQPTAEGLAVKLGPRDSAVLGAGRAPVAAAVSWDGGVRAPFLDEETGQVTIYNVAAQ
jgi:anti-sigma-K factor RskA